MTHPLTDDIIEEISVSYLKNCEGVKSNMRSAADWQLEQCIAWLKNLHPKYTLAKHSTLANMMEEAMRPQQQEN